VLFQKKNRAVYVIIWKNMVQPDRPQLTIWGMRFAWWITKATNTHSGYIILTAFPLQQWLHECALHVRCQSYYNQDGQCTLRSMKWVFKWKRLRFVLPRVCDCLNESVTCQKNRFVIHNCKNITHKNAALSTEVCVCLLTWSLRITHNVKRSNWLTKQLHGADSFLRS
jgi:hypothetical protein